MPASPDDKDQQGDAARPSHDTDQNRPDTETAPAVDPNRPDRGLMVAGEWLGYSLGPDSVKQGLKLLEVRNRLEFDRFQGLQVKAAALFSGIVVLLAVVPRNPAEQTISFLLFVALGILLFVLLSRGYDFAPTTKSVVKGLKAAQSIPDEGQQLSRAFLGSLETYQRAILSNFKANNLKAALINAALIVMAVWALASILIHVPYVERALTPVLNAQPTSPSTGKPTKSTKAAPALPSVHLDHRP